MQALNIYFDPLTAPSWLALKPVLALIERLHVNASWQPFMAPRPRQVPEQPNESPSQRHLRVRQAYRDHDQQRYAAWQRIPLETPRSSVERAMLDYALLLASDNGTAGEFLTAAGTHYWSGAIEPMDIDWLGRALGIEDLPANYLAEGEMRLGAARAQAEELGIFDAPVFLLKGELFLGRQHLPAIERIIGGVNPFDRAAIRT